MFAIKKGVALLLLSLSFCLTRGQGTLEGIPLLDAQLSEGAYRTAHSTLIQQVDQLFKEGTLDSLKRYPYYVGKITLEVSDSKTAVTEAQLLLTKLKSSEISQRSLYEAYMSLTDFYDEIGDLNRSLNTTEETYKLISEVPDATPEEIGKIVYNLGVCHLSLGSIDTSKKYFKQALSLYTNFQKTSAQNLSDGYNAMGAVMWISNQLDSAKIYYDEGIAVLLKTNENPIKNLFTATSIRANISLLEQSQGNLTAALKTQKEVITGYDKVIKNTTDTEQREKAKHNKLIAIYNLSSFYNEIGNLGKAKDFISYSYDLAKQILEPNDPELPRYQIALGQVELSLQNYEEAVLQSSRGLQGLENLKVHDPFWKAMATSTLASAYGSQGNVEKAQLYFDEGEAFFTEALGSSYSREYLVFLRDKALFLVKTGQKKQAIEVVKKGYTYLQEIGQESSLPFYKSIRDISTTYYLLGDYAEASNWADRGLTVLAQNQQKFEGELSAIQIDFYKPPLLLLKAQSAYKLRGSKTEIFLKEQLALLNEATDILEKRKVVTTSAADINLLNDEYKAINDFAKKLYLELHTETGKERYLQKVITLQESGIYGIIRSKLNMERTISFADVPTQVIGREKHLKTQLKNALSDVSKPVEVFFDSDQEWNLFLDSLKVSHPKYFQMRYASLEESLNGLQDNIPDNTTLIRYLFIEDILYAYVVDADNSHWIRLNFDREESLIKQLSNYENSLEVLSRASNLLYNQLWEPIENLVSTRQIIIFPDQELFNLSFELLSSHPIEKNTDFISKSLLAKYDISYNYSLFLLDKARRTIEYAEDFIAFAPEFDEDMKRAYELAITDSMDLDKSYLTLLPQPFSSTLAKKFGKKFKGRSFLNQRASKQLFTEAAKEHKIIHIGTHAESNNISPELSRLVFAKNVSDTTAINDNYLYTFEIYNHDLSSNLAILTACETGKPSYQPGEGMISLAHAFNYSGSESILTSLWQIDEQSSAEILDYFYEYLADGNSKDAALRMAKLDYLKNNEGRKLHPQYWGGLVLMGDTTPIKLSEPASRVWWFVLVAGVVLLLFLFYLKKKRSHVTEDLFKNEN